MNSFQNPIAVTFFYDIDLGFVYEGDTAKQGLILWNNSAGIEAITQFILSSLLHVTANPLWGVKTANESYVLGSLCVKSKPLAPCSWKHKDLTTTHVTFYPVWDVYICVVTLLLLKAPSSVWHSKELRDMLRIRLNPHPCLISCATVSIKHERDATRSGWVEFYQCKSPQLLL